MYSMSKRLFYSEMRRGKYFLKIHHLTVKAGFVILSLHAGSASGGIRRSLLCPEHPDLPKSGVWDRQGAEGGMRRGVSCPGLPGTSESGLSSPSVSADVLG